MDEKRPGRRRPRQISVFPFFVYAAVLIFLLGAAVTRAQDGETVSRREQKESTEAGAETAGGNSTGQNTGEGQPGSSETAQTAGVSDPAGMQSTGETGEQAPGQTANPLAGSGQVQVTISAAGDCTLGTDEHFDKSTSLPAMYQAKGADWFFAGVKDIFAADDLTLVNLEGTFTTSTARADKTYAFKADPEYAGILTAGSVEAVNVANNHSRDYGEQSYTDTVSAVEAAGIAVSGYDKVAVVEKNGVKIGMTGLSTLSGMEGKEEQLKTNIESLRAQGANLIITSFHWGIEKENTPTSDQIAMAHAAIDAGSDLVLGHHPHVLQGIEVYKGKYICYSLGNFCFGGNKNPKDKDTMIFQQTFTFVDGALQTDGNVKIIPCSLSSVSDRNDYQPTPVSGSEAERINTRIEEFSSKLR